MPRVNENEPVESGLQGHRIAFVWVSAVYIASFFFPVKLAEPFQNGPVSVGLDVFLQVLEALFSENTSWSAFGVMLPNILLWIGLTCLWWRRPDIAFLAGLFAMPIAAGWMLVFGLFPILHDPRPQVESFIAQNLGAYLWLASMAALTIAGLLLCIVQTERRRRTQKSYPEICKSAEQATPQSP